MSEPYGQAEQKRLSRPKRQRAIGGPNFSLAYISESVRGPTADLTLLKQSDLLPRLPDGVGGLGDLADMGMAALHPTGLGATPRRKPRVQERPAVLTLNT